MKIKVDITETRSMVYDTDNVRNYPFAKDDVDFVLKENKTIKDWEKFFTFSDTDDIPFCEDQNEHKYNYSIHCEIID